MARPAKFSPYPFAGKRPILVGVHSVLRASHQRSRFKPNGQPESPRLQRLQKGVGANDRLAEANAYPPPSTPLMAKFVSCA
jgi:hypothetical protein